MRVKDICSWRTGMIINNVIFNVDLETILLELRNQLSANNILLLQKMKPTSTHVMVQCPYHANGMERRPSAGLRKSDGIFHCFACNETHSLSEVISYCFGHDDDVVGKFGWQWLLRNFATVQIEERKDVSLDFSRRSTDSSLGISNRNGSWVCDRSVSFVTEEELDKYRYFHPYMYKRGLTDDIIELFDIGYDSATESITFPVRDIAGRCLFVARRSVKTKFFNYPEGVEKPLYGLYEYYSMFTDSKQSYFDLWARVNPQANEIVVCESMLDALSFWTIGKYAVALNGVESELQIKQLKKLPCRKIILATDSDEKGMLARQRIRKKIGNRKLITEYIFPKGRKDANDCTKQELLDIEEVFVY